MSGPKWDDGEIERLRMEWAAGLSIPKIAQRMGKTRSAVAGKAKRLGLKKHEFRHDQGNKAPNVR
jgi:hypothetical protein